MKVGVEVEGEGWVMMKEEEGKRNGRRCVRVRKESEREREGERGREREWV